MKKIISLFSLASLVLILASCGGPEKILPKKDGTWTLSSQTTREFVSNTLDTTYTETNLGTMVFEKDGGGTYTDVDSTYAITWTADDKEETVSICQTFFGGSLCLSYDVLESSKDQLKMTTTFTYSSGTYDEIDVTLDRKK